MSDFSSGIMFGEAFKELAKKYREEDTYLVKLSDIWLCRLSKNDFCKMTEESYSEAVLNLSVHAPLMHIINAEDHGFEIGILHNKKIVFHFQVIYGIEGEFAFHIGEELYGDEYMELICDDKVQENIDNEVEKRYSEIDEILETFFSQITREGIMQFKLFGFGEDICNKIKDILTVDNYKKDQTGHQMIAELLSVLMLSRFNFVSYDYVNPEDGIFEIVG